MSACGRWAVLFPWPPQGGAEGAGNAATRLECSWSVAGPTLKVICPPDHSLPGAAGHCQSAGGGGPEGCSLDQSQVGRASFSYRGSG